MPASSFMQQAEKVIMRIYIVILFLTLGFAQINWEMETVDDSPGLVGYFSSLVLDINDIPHIVYAITQVDTNLIMYAFKTESCWQKETVDVCLTGGPYWGLPYHGVSLAIGNDSKLHTSFYRYDSLNNRTALCYAYRDSLSWTIQVLDSMAGTMSWVPGYHTSIALDTSGYPGIAYSYWNLTDSLQYIKYLHYNGVNWNTFIVEDGCACWDFGPSLKIDSRNQPHIAYYQLHPDSLKYLYYDNQLNTWVIVFCQFIGAVNSNVSLSLVLDSQDHPGIAHSFDNAIAYSWNDGILWYTDIVGGAGYSEVSIALDLDSLENPHIAYSVEFNFWLEYAYKDTTWHLCGPHYGTAGHISLILDNNSNPHITFGPSLYYVTGKFIGIVENDKQQSFRNKRCRIRVFPNISSGLVNVEYTLPVKSEIELSLYDIYGVEIKTLEHRTFLPGNYHQVIDIGNLCSGIYFLILKQNNEQVSRKFLLIR